MDLLGKKNLLNRNSKFHETKRKSELYSKIRHARATAELGNASQHHSLIK